MDRVVSTKSPFSSIEGNTGQIIRSCAVRRYIVLHGYVAVLHRTRYVVLS